MSHTTPDGITEYDPEEVQALLEQGRVGRDDEIVVFNTGAAQKYPEAVPLDLPRLDKDHAIDYERLLN